ncbi:MAG: hypothetical protein ACHQ51_04825 [Elusimicrobiota bacterium]
MAESSSESPKCCPNCSADLMPAGPDGTCRHCKKPLPAELLKLLPGTLLTPSTPNPAPKPRRATKVTLDLTQLLQEGKITEDEFDRLLTLSGKDTKSLSFSIFTTFAVIAVAAGTVGLFPEFFKTFGQALLELLGARGLHLLVVILCGAGALRTDSGFLAASCAFGILTFLGDTGVFYTHASYFVAISEPALTVVIFTALAYASYARAGILKPTQQRVAAIFSRTCVFIVNMGFWVGSLWGSKLGGVNIPDMIFAVGWAAALIAMGAWAAKENKRWVVNTTAVFGSIHFYTQWFERLGATPGSLLFAGAAALGIIYCLRDYNRRIEA